MYIFNFLMNVKVNAFLLNKYESERVCFLRIVNLNELNFQVNVSKTA